ncbi:type III-B CRISPR module RAMP protein Cmr4 [Cohnella faecalis]|nr:type III-B CRISPR module RAMP protein Cmr4 [Cohnella faecalis]
MVKNGKMYFFHCLSPVHIGAGQGIGDIELPIVRERTTEWPYVPGSSVKGVHRRYYKRLEEGNKANGITSAWTDAVFGRSGDKDMDDSNGIDEGNAGALVFTDSRILAFPVASVQGVFAYVTSPMALRRIVQDSKAIDLDMPDPGISQLQEVLDKDPKAAFKCPRSKLVVPGGEANDKEIWLDEFQFEAQYDLEPLAEWADWAAWQLFPEREMEIERSNWIRRLVVVSDEAFHYFVTMCCEITPRIRLKQETKTVEKGALWKEEYIPSEAILYGLVWCDKVYASGTELSPDEVLRNLHGNVPLQLGANVSVGKGRVRYLLTGEAAKR